MKLEVIKYHDKSIVGTLITTLEKIIKKNDSIDYKDFSVLEKYSYGNNAIDVYDVFELDHTTATKIYYEIINEKLELLEPCNHPFKIRRKKNEKFVPDCLRFLHGSYVTFKTTSRQISKSVAIQTFDVQHIDIDVENNSINNLPEKQKNAQKIINAINERMDINKEFSEAVERIIKRNDDYLYSYILRGYIISFLNAKK